MRRRRLTVVVVTAALAAAGCAGADAAGERGAAGTGPEGAAVVASTVAPTTSTTAYLPTTTTAPPPLRPVAAPRCPGPLDDARFRPTDVGRAPSTTEPPPPPPVSEPPRAQDPAPTTTAPPDVGAAVDAFVHDPRLEGTTVGASVWLEGKGEAASVNADQLLIPASVEKLVTAMGAFVLLDLDDHLTTELVATGPITDGVLHGDLVLVGGGDPVLTRVGPDSLDELAQRAADAGLREVDGRLLIDESRYDTVRRGQNWPGDWLSSIGPLSALGVDHDMITKDPTYVADPALGNGAVMRFGLGAHHIAVDGGVAHGQADEGMRIASVDSPPIRTLLSTMLQTSDNFIAELLTKEIGHRSSGQPGTTADGLAAIHGLVTNLCAPAPGVAVDGSGLSRDDRRSPRELRRLLQVAESQPWGDDFVSSLSIAGEQDALANRLRGPATAGRVRAKGGFLFAAKSLSGYLTTTDGRRVVFSVVVNGDLSSPKNKADEAIDAFVTELATLPG
jgi:D-alanyl-D-alanine carboxypeptidase/D-alanyl-D-alanine-endopeptidase (penicillin-binding protein 4)